jgi:hypothetical protein
MVSKSISMARGLVLLGFALGLAGGPAGAATTEGSDATTDLGRLAGLLQQRGWPTRSDAYGNLLISRSVADPQIQAATDQAPARSGPRVDTSVLADRLPSHGWLIQRDAAGTLTLRPPATLLATHLAATAPVRVAAAGESQIREALARRGWDLRRDVAGNLLLTPRA